MTTSPILVWRREISEEPGLPETSGAWAVKSASACDPSDDLSGPWLRLQQVAFAPLGRRRPWTVREFRRELVDRPAWDPQRLLIVESPTARGLWIGSLYLDFSLMVPRAAIRWFAVDPAWQQRGIGRALLAAASQSTFRAGRRQLEAETLASWTQACAFYQRQQFVTVRYKS